MNAILIRILTFFTVDLLCFNYFGVGIFTQSILLNTVIIHLNIHKSFYTVFGKNVTAVYII